MWRLGFPPAPAAKRTVRHDSSAGKTETANVPASSSNAIRLFISTLSSSIRGVIDPVIGRDRAQIERIDAFQAADVVAVLIRIGAPLVVGVDAAARAEVMFGGTRIELVQPQDILACKYLDPRQRYRCDDCPFASADRTVAAARCFALISMAPTCLIVVMLKSGLASGEGADGQSMRPVRDRSSLAEVGRRQKRRHQRL